jgi:hypothetical protein
VAQPLKTANAMTHLMSSAGACKESATCQMAASSRHCERTSMVAR